MYFYYLFAAFYVISIALNQTLSRQHQMSDHYFLYALNSVSEMKLGVSYDRDNLGF